MTKGLQQRRGNTAQHEVFNGEPGEITINTDRWTVVVQDGTTDGGYEHVNLNANQRITNKDIVATNLTVSGVSTFVGIGTFENDLYAFGNISDTIGNVRSIPQNEQTSPSGYTLIASDAGAMVAISTGGITIPSNVFATGDIISIYNNSGIAQTIYQGTNVVLRLAATSSTGTRYLSQYGLCSVVCVSAATTTFVISGAGLT